MPPRKIRRRKKAPAKIELPEPLWAEIASHMSTKDWAMVSGTCRTTFNLQPRTIDFPSATPPAGVIWASKRLGDVEVLRLCPAGALGLAGTGVPDSSSLINVKQLEIVAPREADAAASLMMWLGWVLSRPQKLVVLSASVGHLEWFPPMVQLKHLVLSCDWGTGNLFAALPHAKGLQTLCLHAGRKTGTGGIFNAPPLNLACLPDLRAVALHGVYPHSARFPEECGLHLACRDLSMLEYKEWDSALANVRSLDYGRKDSCLEKLCYEVEVFEALQNLSIVSLHFRSCGTAKAPVLLEDLAHVQQLHVGAHRKSYITVPAKVSWQKLELWGAQKLDVTFEDIDAFARTGTACAFSSRNLVGACLFQLCLILAERGIPWASCREESGVTSLAYPTKDAAQFSGCFCGACMKCLRASGVAKACSSVPLEGEATALDGESSDEDEDQDEDEEDVPPAQVEEYDDEL